MPGLPSLLEAPKPIESKTTHSNVGMRITYSPLATSVKNRLVSFRTEGSLGGQEPVSFFTAGETEAQADHVTERGVAVQYHLPRMGRLMGRNDQAFTLGGDMGTKGS